jgi:catecholate siderophore receptor
LLEWQTRSAGPQVVDAETALQVLIAFSFLAGRRPLVMHSFSRRVFQLFSVIVTAAMLLGQARAQAPEFSLRGKVRDPNQAPIAEAQITATPAGGARGFSTVSDQFGEFALLLKPGSYTLKVIAPGFEESSQAISISTAEAEFVVVGLQIAAPHDTVTVVGTDYLVPTISSATKTLTPLRDVPQSLTVVTREQIKDQQMLSLGDVVRYVPGVTVHQGENNRDQIIFRGNSSSADFFLNGVRDDVQYYRDLYNLDGVEVLRGPNAMIFGRGGGGGVINRVSKEAGFAPLREVTLLGGSFGNKRAAVDFDQPFGKAVAFRVNGVYENSDSFRDHVGLERYGISPTVTLMPGEQTKVTLSYENFRDHRTADRGIPSFQDRPVDIDNSTYFGDPNQSRVRALVNLGAAAVEHQAGLLNIRNRTQVGAYDRFYQNFVPGAVTADQAKVALSAYNNATRRLNIFNQTDVTYSLSTGHIRHTLLGGVEIGRQLTDNFRNTGYFNDTITSILLPLADPRVQAPVTFRPSATDADNHLKVNVAATYAQDQIELSRYVQVVAGLRFDRFDLQYHNNRTGDDLGRTDHLISPRAGLIFKPLTQLSIYTNYSVSYLPSSGDQFSSLTTITQQVKPEKFSNYEFGVKWDINRALSFTTAGYRLNRTNTRATDPNDPTRIVQTGSQRTNGYEVGLNGSLLRAWKIAGGYAYQAAFITSATAAARAGAQVAQVPHHTFSLWNNYQIIARLGAGLGLIHRSDMYAAVDNKVTLPGYTRADAAVFFVLTEKLRLQANVENLLDKRYYLNADSNTNISPGSSRAIRVGLTARF